MVSITDWSMYPNFSQSELECRETGECKMDADFMFQLQALRSKYGKPMIISSGYRSPRHSIEAAKDKAGVHTLGKACDILVSGEHALELLGLAIRCGFTGVGVKQKGSNRFIHLDTATIADGFPRPMVWSY